MERLKYLWQFLPNKDWGVKHIIFQISEKAILNRDCFYSAYFHKDWPGPLDINWTWISNYWKIFFKLLDISLKKKRKKDYPHEVLHSQFSYLDFVFYFYFYWATPVILICFVCWPLSWPLGPNIPWISNKPLKADSLSEYTNMLLFWVSLLISQSLKTKTWRAQIFPFFMMMMVTIFRWIFTIWSQHAKFYRYYYIYNLYSDFF